jgi:hypothetical protein
MFQYHIFSKLLIVLLLLGLLFGGASTIYRMGWTQGYSLGVITAVSSEGGKTIPGFNPYLANPYFASPFSGFGNFFNPFGLCLGVGFFFLLLFLIGGVFRGFGRRGWSGGPGSHGQPDWGSEFPWAKEWREWREWKESQAKKEAESGETPQGEEYN